MSRFTSITRASQHFAVEFQLLARAVSCSTHESLYFLQQWPHNKPVYYTPWYMYLCGKRKMKKKKEKKRGRGSPPSLPHYIELRDTMGSPKHKTGRECSGALLYRRYNSSVMPLFNHRYDRSLHSPSCVRSPERRNPAAPTNVKVN